MPALAHFQAAKTVYDVLKRHTEAETLPTRKELMAEMTPIMKILGRKMSTAQAMLDVMVRCEFVIRHNKEYAVCSAFNMRKFALEVDRNNTHKMVISYIDVGDPAKPTPEPDGIDMAAAAEADADNMVTIPEFEVNHAFGIPELHQFNDMGIQIIGTGKTSPNGQHVYIMKGSKKALRNYLQSDKCGVMEDDEMDERFPMLML
jgi:hypothetical protein